MVSDGEGGLILRHDVSMLRTEVTEEELQFRNAIIIDNNKFKSEKINCTACNKNLKDNILTKLEFYVHPSLQVPICKNCFEFYGTGEFTHDDDGTDEFCRWCGQGGEVICCFRCSVVICIKCIKSNFPKEYRKETDKDDWQCFVCDTKPIWPLRALAATALKYIEKQKKKRMKRREFDEDEATDAKKLRQSESEDDEVKPTKSLRNRKRDEATGSKRSRRSKSSEDESLEPKKLSRTEERVAKKKRGSRSISSERKSRHREPTVTLSDNSSDDNDNSNSVHSNKSKTTARKSSRKTRDSSKNEDQIGSQSKDEFSALLKHTIADSVMDYNRLIKVMTQSHKNYIKGYLKNKKLWMDNDGRQRLIDEYHELLAKTKHSIDRLERTFLAGMKSLNLSCTKVEDAPDNAVEIEPMSVDEEAEKTENDDEKITDNENVENGRSTVDKTVELDVEMEVNEEANSDEDANMVDSDGDNVPPTDAVNAKDLNSTSLLVNVDSFDERDKVKSPVSKEKESVGKRSEVNADSFVETDRTKSPESNEKKSVEKWSEVDADSFDERDRTKSPESNEKESAEKRSEGNVDSSDEKDRTKSSESKENKSAEKRSEGNADSSDERDETKSSESNEKKSAEKQIPADSPASEAVESNVEENEDKTIDSEKEDVAKAALLDSSQNSLVDSGSEGRADDTVGMRNNEKLAKATLLESSNSDTGNDEKGKSNDSDVSRVQKLSEDENRQSRKRRLKKHERSKTKKIDTDDDDDKEIDRLTRLDNLHARRSKRSSSHSGSGENVNSEKENQMDNTNNSAKKLSLRTKKKRKNAVDFISDGSDSGNENDDNAAELSFDNFDSMQEQKERESTLNKDQMSKKLLLMDSDSDARKSDSESDDDVTNMINESMKGKKKKKSDGGSKKSAEKPVDSDDSDNSKSEKKKGSWRNDPLLRGKLSETDTSDEERAVERARKKDLAEKEKKAAERAAKGSGSSDSEDLFMAATSSTKIKKRKRKISSSGSEAPVEISSNSSSVEVVSEHETKEKRKPTKKRKRIRTWRSSDSEKDDENKSQTGSATKGRKNIRKIIGEEDLDEETRKMAKAEEDRRKRLAEKQALFEQSFKMPDEGDDHEGTLVLDFDPQTKEEIISVHPKLLRRLKPHQAKGVKFMWDSCFESVKQIENNNKGGGCILAHCMGLGKTLQVITLVHTVLRYSEITKIKTVLIICPLSTVLNWVNEFEHWLKNIDDNDFDVSHLNKHKNNAVRADHLNRWLEDGGVMITGYDMFRNLVNNKKLKPSVKAKIDGALLDPGPDLVICDEGHVLKNESSGVSLATMQIKTLRRIVLTGTPLQNNLVEYHCMVQFVKPNLLGTRKEFLNRFVNPITNGQYTNSTEKDVKVMKKRAHVLHKMLDGIVQRFDYKVLMPFLPPKHEFVISVALSDLQAKLYDHYIKTYSKMSNHGTSLFKDYQIMRLIWTHPYAMKLSAERAAKIKQAEDDVDSLKDFVVSGSDDSSSSGSSVVSVSDEKNNGKAKMRTRSNGKAEEEEVIDLDNNTTSAWWSEFISSEDIEDYKQGPKLVLLFAILRECENRGDKVLIFSQSIPSLDMIEYFLEKSEELSQYAPFLERGNVSHIGNWRRNADYFRLDGSTPNEARARYCNAFNRVSNKRARLFLISTKAGGLGINLTAANRVIIFDASWNPSHDVQSIFRVFRFGQSKPCYIYRFLSQGTMEEKIYERQVTKLSISCRVVDEQQIDRHFSRNEIEELYTFNRKIPDENETPKLPNDDLMAEMLKAYKNHIISYHEHDSLLENIVDEELTEEERKQAWEEYEHDKKPKPVINMAMKSNAISMDDILAAVRREHPDASEEVLRVYANQVKAKLRAAQQTAMQQQQAMYMNSQQFAERQEMANLQLAASRYQVQQQMQNQRRENQPPLMNPNFAHAGFGSPQKVGYSTPQKPTPGYSGFGTPQTYQSPVKRSWSASPLKTPTKDDGNGSDVEENSVNTGVGWNPLKTPQTWAFKWTINGGPEHMTRILQSNCQWQATYEQIGDNLLMHLPFCVRRDTLEQKLLYYLPYMMFTRVVPCASERDLLNVIAKEVVLSDTITSNV